MNAALMEHSAQFRSVDAALRFYCDGNTAAYETSSMSDLIGGSRPDGNGLGGLDGAGERGIIGSNLKTLPQLWRRLLLAKFTKPEVKCYCLRSCCSRMKINGAWAIEIAYIGETVMLDLHAPLLKQKPQLREDIIGRFCNRRHFGEKLTNAQIAKRNEVSERSVQTYSTGICGMLKNEYQRAYSSFDERLRTAKVVGD
jgi:hypothetical protein